MGRAKETCQSKTFIGINKGKGDGSIFTEQVGQSGGLLAGSIMDNSFKVL